VSLGYSKENSPKKLSVIIVERNKIFLLLCDYRKGDEN
tara:strand:+ start:1503 stop:1616 length:114 start_codon:yes stop_codon:yes gene_type:complete